MEVFYEKQSNPFGEGRGRALAFSECIGMTTENMKERGSDPAEDRRQDVRARFEQRIRDCFEQYEKAWLQKSREVLIEEAAEIASVQRMARELPSSATEEDMAYLLRFKNPLEVVSDRWRSETDMGLQSDSGLDHVLWELRDRQDAEYDYEMEPEHYGSTEPTPQSPGLTMQT